MKRKNEYTKVDIFVSRKNRERLGILAHGFRVSGISPDSTIESVASSVVLVALDMSYKKCLEYILSKKNKRRKR